MAADRLEELQEFVKRAMAYKQGEVVSLMMHIGDRLGLYEAMAGLGPLSAAELAESTGLHERWLLECPGGRLGRRHGDQCRQPVDQRYPRR